MECCGDARCQLATGDNNRNTIDGERVSGHAVGVTVGRQNRWFLSVAVHTRPKSRAWTACRQPILPTHAKVQQQQQQQQRPPQQERRTSNTRQRSMDARLKDCACFECGDKGPQRWECPTLMDSIARNGGKVHTGHQSEHDRIHGILPSTNETGPPQKQTWRVNAVGECYVREDVLRAEYDQSGYAEEYVSLRAAINPTKDVVNGCCPVSGPELFPHDCNEHADDGHDSQEELQVVPPPPRGTSKAIQRKPQSQDGAHAQDLPEDEEDPAASSRNRFREHTRDRRRARGQARDRGNSFALRQGGKELIPRRLWINTSLQMQRLTSLIRAFANRKSLVPRQAVPPRMDHIEHGRGDFEVKYISSGCTRGHVYFRTATYTFR